MRDREAGYHSLTTGLVGKVLNNIPRHRHEKHANRPQRAIGVSTQDSHVLRRQSRDYDLEFRHLPGPQRALSVTSLCSDTGAKEVKPAKHQTESPLFMLPEEIRQMIYEQLLGGKTFHIVRRRAKLGHIQCKASLDSGRCMSRSCRGYKLPSGVHIGSGDGGLIQVLQSCQRVYSESVEVLYLQNVFDFNCSETLVAFSCAILPQRLDRIRRLSLNFRFDQSLFFSECTPQSDWPRWERVWRIIASMLALREIRMSLCWKDFSKNAAEELRVLEPLKLVAGLETFTVTLPSSRTSGAWKERDMPFRVLAVPRITS